jgi:hypothetical protein
MLVIRLAPLQSMAPKSKVWIFFQVGRVNGVENADTTDKILVVIAGMSLY